MTTEKPRILFTVDQETKEQLDQMKMEKRFALKPSSVLYRYVMKKGLEAYKNDSSLQDK